MDTGLGSLSLTCASNAIAPLNTAWTNDDRVALVSHDSVLPAETACELTLTGFAAASDPADPMAETIIYFETSPAVVEITEVGVWEDFTSFETCFLSCATSGCVPSASSWRSASGLREFSVETFGTPSSGTGPNGDHTYGSSDANSRFIYTEASSCSNQMHGIESGVMVRRIQAGLALWTHMRGNNIPYSVHADAREFDGRTWSEWTEVSSLDGSNVNAWVQLPVPVSTPVGAMFQLRLRGSTGSNYLSDVAIDDLEAVGPDGTGTRLVSAKISADGVVVVFFFFFFFFFFAEQALFIFSVYIHPPPPPLFFFLGRRSMSRWLGVLGRC